MWCFRSFLCILHCCWDPNGLWFERLQKSPSENICRVDERGNYPICQRTVSLKFNRSLNFTFNCLQSLQYAFKNLGAIVGAIKLCNVSGAIKHHAINITGCCAMYWVLAQVLSKHHRCCTMFQVQSNIGCYVLGAIKHRVLSKTVWVLSKTVRVLSKTMRVLLKFSQNHFVIVLY